MHTVELCADSGLLPSDACPRRATEWAPADRHLDRCDWHHASDRGVITIWPEKFRAWARDAGLLPSPAALATVTTIAATRASADTPVRSAATRATTAQTLTIVKPLAGAVYSGSEERAIAFAHRIRAGMVSVNGGACYGHDMPFGGYKQSVVGRQNGLAGLEQYVETKAVAWPAP